MTDLVTDLVTAYRPLALSIARDYFIPGADRDDVRQEALVGLLCAVRDYRPDRGVSFASFAHLVIERWLQDKVTAARRHKHQMLTKAEREGTVDLRLIPGGLDPAEEYERREEFRTLMDGVRALCPLEREGLRLLLDGEPYTTRPDGKRIDNAIQRARKKLREAA